MVASIDRTAMTLLGGVEVIYQPGIGAPVTVTGIFDTPYVLSQGDVQAGVGTSEIKVFLRIGDLPTDPETDEPILFIGGVAYRVVERDADDFGGITLHLRTDG